MSFNLPPALHNEKGDLRKAGFELEFANVNIEDSTHIVQSLFGGKLQKKNRFFYEVVDTSIGDFTIKIDLRLLSEREYRKLLEKFNIDLKDVQLGENNLEYELETVLEAVASKLIPYEIVTPPVPVTEVEQFEKLRLALFEHDAEGTKSSLTNAFATHVNIEVPSTSTETLLNYMKAFLLLYPYIFKISEVDIARRVTTFINPFPAKYIDMVLGPRYTPDLKSLILDYHTYNPDRNRPLDMYPIFAALRKDIVDAFENLGFVKERLTFHYRLPNSQISEKEWSLAKEWNHWILVEELANDPEKIMQISHEYLLLRENVLMGFENKWIKQIEKWLS